MKIALPDFRRAVGLVAGIVESRNTIPILSNIAISGSGVGVVIRATDLDMELVATLAGEGSGVSTTVDARRLALFATRVDGEDIFISPIDGKNSKLLRFEADDAYADMAMLPIDDYPAIGPTDYGADIEFDPSALAADLLFCQPAISTEETRYYLNGICIHPKDGHWNMVATDGHRLNLARVNDKPVLPNDMMIIPRKAVALMLRVIAACPGENRLTLAFTQSKMRMICGRYTMITKLIDGTYPDYRRAIPAEDAGRAFIKVEGRELNRAVLTATAIATEKTRAVKLTTGTGHTLKLTTTCPETGEASARCRGSAVDGLSFEIGFNARYLSVLGRLFGAATMMGRFSDAASPSLWTSEQAPGRLVVLMPMRV